MGNSEGKERGVMYYMLNRTGGPGTVLLFNVVDTPFRAQTEEPTCSCLHFTVIEIKRCAFLV